MSKTTTAPDFLDKGLATGKIGTLAGAVLGISCVAPGYTLTTSIGLIVAAVGLKMPAIFLAGFVPMFLTAYAYRELNSRMPDCGASFTWSTRAFGPYAGWMCGWGMVMASILVLSNIASIAVGFFYLFLARLFDRPELAELGHNKVVDIVSTLTFLAVSMAVAGRGITTSRRVQYALVGFQMVVLVVFAVTALAHVGAADAPAGARIEPDWFNPFTGLTLGAFTVGVTGSIFAFWGWDTCLTLGEESKDPRRVPGRAGLLCVLSILCTYVLLSVAVLAYAGIGDSGVGLGNPANADNVFGALAEPVLGRWGGPLLLLAILASSVASLQTTFLPAARTMLAMGVYGAFPKRFAAVHPRFRVPSYGTVIAGVVTGAFYTTVTLLSEHALMDTVAALGIMICWYYGITAFACVWLLRGRRPAGPREAVLTRIFPLLGGAMLLVVFVVSVRESMDPANGSGAAIGGVGLVFFMGFGMLLLGAVLMLVMRRAHPAFFRDELPIPAEQD
ncbi:APC family permease [Nocardia sp. CDC159]|uniref:APC family permease n=1 Tax=Nocardia pulmonis TaxID=2951408 RepID=A0A9X2ITP2_9NOCA|nr:MULTISPECIES: APC family permease [Nocardia]MCM6771997.1 APC family permease [Nocardia pulmonis]MCM6785345.1 APC family permease [Nocardia sp. CDC159]